MSLRKFPGWLLAPAVVVAVSVAGAHANMVGGVGADVDAAFGRGLLRTADAARDRFSTGLQRDCAREGGASCAAIEVASRCSKARPAASTSARSRSSSSGSKSGARRKATIWNIPSQTGATGQKGGEASGRGGGFYDENGNFHPDGARP